MGLSPREVDGLSLWEYAACFEAWQRANTAPDDLPMTRQQYDEAAALLQRIDAAPAPAR